MTIQVSNDKDDEKLDLAQANYTYNSTCSRVLIVCRFSVGIKPVTTTISTQMTLLNLTNADMC